MQNARVGSNSACPFPWAFAAPPEGSIDTPAIAGDVWLSGGADCFPAAWKCSYYGAQSSSDHKSTYLHGIP